MQDIDTKTGIAFDQTSLSNPQTEQTPYNFAASLFASPFASSLNTLFKIFPEAFFGIASTHLTPPSSILKLANLSLIQA